MPVQKSKSSLSAKLGEKAYKSHETHKDEAPRTGGGGDLPGGINGGIAQLTKCGFGDFETGNNKGKPYFMAMGVVIEPSEHAGKHTKVGPIPLCDTKKADGTVVDFDTHYNRMLDELKKLVLKNPRDKIEFGVDDLEGIAAALVQDAPHFRFDTSEGKKTEEYPNPRVFENWRGRCEYDGELQSGVEDNSGEIVDKTETADDDVPFGDDLDMLADKAGEKDKKGNPTEEAKEAQTRIAELAEEAGVADESGKADTWEASVEIIREAKTGTNDNETSEEATEETTADERLDPVKTELYFYKYPRTKTEKPKEFNSRKPIECEVVSVDKKTRTVVLKDLSTQKNLKSPVSWDDLQDEA